MHCATLRRTLNNAKDDILIFDAPDFTLFKEKGRSLRLNEEAERRLLQVADQPLKEIVVVMRGTGMRNAREYRILVEDIDFDAESIIVPDSKTARRRFHLTRRLIVPDQRIREFRQLRAATAQLVWRPISMKHKRESKLP